MENNRLSLPAFEKKRKRRVSWGSAQVRKFSETDPSEIEYLEPLQGSPSDSDLILPPIGEEDSDRTPQALYTPDIRSILKSHSSSSGKGERVSSLEIARLTPLKVLSYQPPETHYSFPSRNIEEFEETRDRIRREYQKLDQEIEEMLNFSKNRSVEREKEAYELMRGFERMDREAEMEKKNKFSEALSIAYRDLRQIPLSERWTLLVCKNDVETFKHINSFANSHMYGKLSVDLKWTLSGMIVDTFIPYQFSDPFFSNTIADFIKFANTNLSYQTKEYALQNLAMYWEAYIEFVDVCNKANSMFPVSLVSLIDDVFALSGLVGGIEWHINVSFLDQDIDLLDMIRRQILR